MNSPLLTTPPLSCLTRWQKTQAAMLYHYSSLDYLKGLHRIVSDLMDGVVDPIVDLAKQQGRDSILVNERWGARDTVQNWTNNAWPFLSDFRQSLARDMTLRITERYKISGANQCLRGLDEFSLNWTTPEEEESVQLILREISSYSDNIDKTLQDWPSSRWDDFSFAYRYLKFSAKFPRIPKFQIRKDVKAETNKTPPRTGVYIPADESNAALQFAWVGGGGGKLRPASTFNEIGLDALQYAGRKDLWFNDTKMLAFAMSAKYHVMFEKEILCRGKLEPSFATTAVARAAFTEHVSTWYYVEMINDEFEDIAVVSESANDRIESPAPELLRVVGGRACIRSGYWFTPAKSGSRRHFNKGETMPIFDSDYGSTFWQWDTEQK